MSKDKAAPPVQSEVHLFDSDEEDFELLIGFDIEDAKKKLLTSFNSIQCTFDLDHQKDLMLEVGTNLSAENPWRQINKQFLEDNLTTDNYEMEELKKKLHEIEGDPPLLIGYIPHLSHEADTYIIYTTEKSCKEASELIKRLEAAERKKIKDCIYKKPRPYTSLGSEQEVDHYVKQKRTNLVDVEVQSVYPMRYSEANFTMRLAGDVRDGYVELVPKKIQFENVYRKRIDFAVQSAPLRITEEQQTDPTFPTNAWSQYLYEMTDEKPVKEVSIDDSASEVAESPAEMAERKLSIMLDRRKSRVTPIEIKLPPPQETLQTSKQVHELLDTLEFNRVDMYRNDYPFIAKHEILKYQMPYLDEICCFAKITKCKGRYISSIDWHPQFSGVCVVSYAFETPCTLIEDNQETDFVKRTTLENNPVIVWSFDDTLYPKLELEALREVTCISFCPYDGNLIIGGTKNGQVIIWDISDMIRTVETEEWLNPEEAANRAHIRSFLNWTKTDESNKIISSAAMSNIENSHESTITCIKWLPRNLQCTVSGQVRPDQEKKTRFRQFLTTSIDGTILFWNLDWKEDSKTFKKNYKVNLPDELQKEVSSYCKIDNLWNPHYKINIGRPITSIGIKEGHYSYEPTTRPLPVNDISHRIVHKVTEIDELDFQAKLTFGTLLGEVIAGHWEGFEYSKGAVVNSETMHQEPYAIVHDGAVICIEGNPFLPKVFISLGGNVFALWWEDYKSAPIFWRKRPCRLTAMQWSMDRPSVFYVTCENGSLEIWDLNARIDLPSMIESLGGNILTGVSQHKLSLAKKVLAIADFNTNLRILTIPNAFIYQLPDEVEILQSFIADEVERKKEQENWKKIWYLKNKDIIEAKKLADEQIKAEVDKKDRDRKEMEEYKARVAVDDAKKKAVNDAKNKVVFDLPEKLDKKWDEMNYKRLLKIMTDRKLKVDHELLEQQTKPLKDRMKYSEDKKKAIKESFSRIDSDLATIRARLMPVVQHEATREELVKESVVAIIKQESRVYKKFEDDALKVVRDNLEDAYNTPPMTMSEIIRRSKQNREILNNSLGGGNSIGPKERLQRYKERRFSKSPQNRSRSVTFSHELGGRSSYVG